MGKVRRKRTQYHFSSENKKEDINTDKGQSDDGGVDGFNIDVPDNIFKDVKIDIDEMNHDLIEEDDSRSVKTARSVSKSLKSFKRSLGDIHLKKVDKRTLRRNLFLKKIQLTHENIIRSKKAGKGRSALSISEIDKVLPKVDMVFHNPQVNKEKLPLPINTPKPKGISKAKDRKKAMVNNLKDFKKLLSDTSLKSNLMDTVTSSIEKKVFNEEL